MNTLLPNSQLIKKNMTMYQHNVRNFKHKNTIIHVSLIEFIQLKMFSHFLPSQIPLAMLPVSYIFHLDFLTGLGFFAFRDLSSTLLVHLYPAGIANGSESNPNPTEEEEEEHRCSCLFLTPTDDDDDDDKEEQRLSDFCRSPSSSSPSKCEGLESGV